jgi:hypothetical protein
LFVPLLFSCKKRQAIGDVEILAKIHERTLTRSGVTALIPRGVSSADSFLMAENYIKKWAKDVLVYEVAMRNLQDEKTEIDRLVEEYRYSLTRYRYQEKLLRERLSVNIRESDKISYYEENQKKFVLDKGLIKGVFLKIPVNAPGLSEVKTWYKSSSKESLEKIEKYSIQNALIYDYFYDRWVDFDEIMDNIPLRVSNTNAFLRGNRSVEVSDSSYCYLLNIQEYLLSGSIAPYDYAEPQIIEMLINQKKIDFLNRFEEELYNDAIKSGDLIFNTEQ